MANIDVYQEVTNRIIAELEKGIIPWRKPWAANGYAVSRSTGKRYSFINQILLDMPGEYVTYPEAVKLGGHVKKGEKGHQIVSWAKIKKQIEIEDEDGNMKTVEKMILLPKFYTVFELAQCEGIERKYTEEPKSYGHTPIEAAENIIIDYTTREKLQFTQNDEGQAYYSPSGDYVVVPKMERFESIEEFYSTSFHELTHSTGHSSRLNRFTGEAANAAFGSQTYSKEELVAEIGAATLCNIAKLETESSFKNSASYIQSWLKVLKGDKKFIISASARAEKAVCYILGEEATA